jgi:acyl carrier protein
VVGTPTATVVLERAGTAAEPVAPRTATEDKVAEIWRGAFGLDEVGVHAGFVELGGDSVFAFQILTQIAQALGKRIDPEEAFENFTIAHLAEPADLLA